MRKFSTFFLFVLFMSSAVTARASEVFDPGSTVTSPDEYVFIVGWSSPFTHSTLSVQPPAVSEIGVRGDWLYCTSTKDPACDFASAKWGQDQRGIIGMSVLPYCATSASENCIENLEISYQGKAYAPAKHLRMLNSGLVQQPDPSLNYLGGASTSIWDDSGIEGSLGRSYQTNVVYSVNYDPELKKFSINNIAFGITPFREVTGSYRAPSIDPSKPANLRVEWGTDRKTIWEENGRAGIATDFPADARYRITARVTNQITGWYKARLQDPQVSINKFSALNNRVTIEGKPVSVPSFAYKKSKRDFTPLENKWWQNNGQSNNTTPAGADQQDIFEYLDYFRPLVKDTVAGFNSLWTVNSTNWGNDNKCLMDTSRVVGIVSTNAMGFNGNSPKYENGTLNYQVGGMHYLPDGKSLVEGTYDLLLRSEAARCLYGFSNAPIQASISVTGDQNQRTAVTSMIEKDGWIKLSAYGFNFSSPNISVKFSQESLPSKEATKAPTAAATNSVLTKRTISCTKGKVIRKVVGPNPKCPAGFKKR
ncbi:MAG: hypothetical protein EBR76_00765 [Actinobacteria bacterium]|nr:hypothetical protein [Actinomycetota bacterium]